MRTILILDANQRSALAVTRSLGQHGIRVFTADESVTSLSGSSRYSCRYFQYPSARIDENLFITAVQEICLQHQVDILMPVTELTSGLLLKHRAFFDRSILPFADIGTVNTLADKCNLTALAKTLEIPIPPSLEITAGTIPEKLFSEREFPQVLKPGLSWLNTEDGWIHTTVRVADNKDDAMRLIAEDPAFRNHNYLVQNYVSGHGEGIFAIYNHGEAVAFFAHRRLREKPPDGGFSVLSESVDLKPELLKYAKKLLDHVHWHGVAMVEFRVDDENIYLMEVNTRFWGSLQLAIDSGVDFPWLLYRIACGEKLENQREYQKGKRLRYLTGDTKRLLLVLKDGKRSFTHKIKALVSFFSPHPFITRFELLRFADLKPFFWDLRRNLSKRMNRGSS